MDLGLKKERKSTPWAWVEGSSWIFSPEGTSRHLGAQIPGVGHGSLPCRPAQQEAAIPRMSHAHAHATSSVMPSSPRRPLQAYLERVAAAAILCCIAQVRLVVGPGKLLERIGRIKLNQEQQ